MGGNGDVEVGVAVCPACRLVQVVGDHPVAEQVREIEAEPFPPQEVVDACHAAEWVRHQVLQGRGAADTVDEVAEEEVGGAVVDVVVPRGVPGVELRVRLLEEILAHRAPLPYQTRRHLR